jgi:ATP-binding cassette, subfamily B, bacterial MsbA
MSLDSIFRKQNRESWRDDLKIFWNLSKPYMPRLVAAMLCSLVVSAVTGSIAWGMKIAVDDILIAKKRSNIFTSFRLS